MRRLWAVALYLVTWRTFSARLNKVASGEYPGPLQLSTNYCVLDSEAHQEEYSSWFTAAERAHELKLTVENYDVRMWRMDEPEAKEMK